MGHRVAVMRKGELQQVAAPEDLYHRPLNMFVGGFIGSPAMNMLEARAERQNGSFEIGSVSRGSCSARTLSRRTPSSLPRRTARSSSASGPRAWRTRPSSKATSRGCGEGGASRGARVRDARAFLHRCAAGGDRRSPRAGGGRRRRPRAGAARGRCPGARGPGRAFQPAYPRSRGRFDRGRRRRARSTSSTLNRVSRSDHDLAWGVGESDRGSSDRQRHL